MVSNRIFRLAFGKKGVSALSAPSQHSRAHRRALQLCLSLTSPRSRYICFATTALPPAGGRMAEIFCKARPQEYALNIATSMITVATWPFERGICHTNMCCRCLCAGSVWPWFVENPLVRFKPRAGPNVSSYLN